MKLIGLGTAFALLFSAGIAARQAATTAPTQKAADDKQVTLTGCVVKGDGGYVLTDAIVATGPTTTGAVSARPDYPTPAPTGTSGTPSAISAALAARTFYWLDDDDELEQHANQRVEVKGEMEGDIDKGEISVEREQGMIELEFKAEGEKITVKVPDLSTVGTTGQVTDREKDVDYIVRKVDVDSVKMISSTCR